MVACPQFVKYGLLTANLLVFVFGGTLFGVGMRTMADLNRSEKCGLPGTGVLYLAMRMVTAAGPIIALSALLGGLAAFRQYKAPIITYFIVALAGWAVLLAGLILVRTTWHRLPPDFTSRVSDVAYMCKYNQLIKDAWDATKNLLKDNPTFQCAKETVKKYTVGCLKLSSSFLLNNNTALTAFTILASCIMVFGLILGVIIYRIRYEYKGIPQGMVT